MLIRQVLASNDSSSLFFPDKRGLQAIDHSSLTRLGWFRLSPIDQYSSLLPPVGEAIPYEGAKAMYQVNIDNREEVAEVIKATCEGLK